jgi:hypothetical protein
MEEQNLEKGDKFYHRNVYIGSRTKSYKTVSKTIFSSSDPKGRVYFCHYIASVIVHKLQHFKFLLRNQSWVSLNQTW